MVTSDHRRLAAGLLAAVARAGDIVMDHFRRGAKADRKSDGSPVTDADRESERILLGALARLAPAWPVIAEEQAARGEATGEPGPRFFLVDPLDGTKEFLTGETDFTLNIALIEAGAPVFGMVYAPAPRLLYMTLSETEAVRARLDEGAAPVWESLDLAALHTRAPPDRLIATVSRSHLDAPTRRYLARLPVAGTLVAGSSLKFCRIAEGAADVYPRLSRTMEWDTAAGDAVLRAAGGTVLDTLGAPLIYGKRAQGYANGGFVAWGRTPSGGPARRGGD